LKNSHSYQKNEKIYAQGEAATYIYQVGNGAVRIFSMLKNGQRMIGSFYFPGDVFGLEREPRYRWSAEAVVNATTVHRVKQKAFVREAQLNLSLARSLWNFTASELLRAEDHSVVLGLAATERMAAFLLEMNNRIGVNGELELPMKGVDIGDYLAITVETVAREISKFEDQGVMRHNGTHRLVRRFKLHRPERLRAMLPPLSALDLPPIRERVIETIFSNSRSDDA
jgi:CRP/FNR family transcriptional regulator, nitrogen fixation regulation protein